MEMNGFIDFHNEMDSLEIVEISYGNTRNTVFLLYVDT